MKIKLSSNVLLLFIILIKIIITENPIIVIPFKINRIPNTKSSEFETKNFVQEYFYRDFYASISTGIPSKNILALLDTHSHIFLFGENYLKRNSLSEILDPDKTISKEVYDRTASLSFKNISKFHYTNIELKEATLCSDIFLLYNDIAMEKGHTYNDMHFIIDNDMQNKLHIRLGLGKPLTVAYGGPPHFIQSLLNINAIKDQSWTFKFLSQNDGLFILGEEPHIYEDISKDKRYQRKNYFSTTSLSSIEYFNPISFNAKSIYVNEKDDKEVIINQDKGCYLNYNNGFIVATRQYWEYIKKNFFAVFFTNDVCKEELIQFNTPEDVFQSYYVISCDKVKIIEQYKQEFQAFPKLTFFIFDFNYNFEITGEDVFTDVNNVLYFMIIYQKDIFNHEELVYWDLGLPFLLKYQFVHNYEKETIGFYIPEKEEEEKKDDEKEEKPEKTSEEIIVKPEEPETKNNYIYIYTFLGSVVGICLLIGAFCLGKSLYQGRKKKANELDENFDYESNNKDKDKEEGIIN